ncbi:hypothetical protein D3C80_2078850 [compost metagenome]
MSPTDWMLPTIDAVAAATEAMAARFNGNGFAAAIAMPVWMLTRDCAIDAAFWTANIAL